MLEHFERQNVLHSGVVGGIGQAAGTDGDFRSMFYMQHYGVPTRLLDWTSNPFIALYFALSSAKKDKHGNHSEDAAVWVLDPVAWNKRSLDAMGHADRGPLSLSDVSVGGYQPRKLQQGQLAASDLNAVHVMPAAILGVSNNARMFAQKGVFTVFGKDIRAMEVQYDKEAFPVDSLVAINIPKAAIKELIERLINIGYTDSVSFPDLHGLAMEIKRTYGFVV